MIPLLLLLVAQFMPKPAQHGFAVVAVLLWPAEIVAEFLGMVVTDSGGDSSVVISAIPIAISILLNAAIYVGIGLMLWTFGFSRFFQRRSPN